MMDKSTQLTKSMSKISLRKGGGAKKICIEDLINSNIKSFYNIKNGFT